MKKLRERFNDVQQEQQEVEKAFDVIKEITDGLFDDLAYVGDDEHYKHMLQQLEAVKPILFYTRNNKWLVMEYLVEHGEYMNGDKPNSLGQMVSTLLGYQGQDALDNNDEALEDKLHIESCIWSRINLGAKYPHVKAN
ncbi:hypothetical protein DT035_08635 [Bacillus subtilis]|uniref:hypothetical protein n=1 Tax=Bacillus subtilis TaxID=1423 RepID=UPI00145BE939|nr:hypothetical protein [Bacillus subtilis]MBA5714897.1 hypothetical protein [Bacillus subtilis]QNK37965.1 hypothetical protein H8S71_06370 [Bacillus subtilis subsp. subtilis]